MFIHEWNRQICLECLECVNACPNENLTSYEGRPTASDENSCVGCSLCRSSCPTKAVSFKWLDESGYSGDTPTLKSNVGDLSLSGKPRVEGMGARRKINNFTNLLFLPAQLASSPLLEEEEVDTSVILGKKAKKPIKLDIPILIGAMSFGALSLEAKIALARATAVVGSIANSGEGGSTPEEREAATRYTVQFSTGRFGVSEEALKAADMVEIKIGQGAKPGMGGHLLKSKITPKIAEVRGISEDKDAISPARHLDINSRQDLKAKVDWLRETTGGAPVGLKIAGGHVEKDLEIALFTGVDVIAIDGMEGGTGAAPVIAREHAALPLINFLSRASKFLDESGKRDEITLIAAGGLRTSSDFTKAIALGADAVYVSSSAQIAMGCVRCRACHTGLCPAGICTMSSDNKLDVDKATQGVVNFLKGSVEEMKILCRLTGNRSLKDLSRYDMAALDETTARITGVELA